MAKYCKHLFLFINILLFVVIWKIKALIDNHHLIYNRKQVHGFMKYFSVSFLWGLFKWFFSGIEDCGFEQFPTFGLQAWKQTYDLISRILYINWLEMKASITLITTLIFVNVFMQILFRL